MCNLSEGVEQRGIEKGMAKGRERGILESIQSLMDTLQLTSDQAMNALKISESDRTKYIKMLEQ